MQRPLTRRGTGRSVSLTTAVAAHPAGMPRLRASRSADTEVFYMAGRRLGALQRQLLHAGWPAETPACVVSRAGCADQVASDHRLSGLCSASVLHAGRPTVVTLGAGARAIVGAAEPAGPAGRTGVTTVDRRVLPHRLAEPRRPDRLALPPCPQTA
jgi:uroporphyrin-III C-methyltransferase